VVAYTNAFTITVACDAIPLVAIPTTSPHLVPNVGAAATNPVVAGSSWHSSSYKLGVCALTYQIIDVSTTVALTGGWITVDALGNVAVNWLVWGSETVFVRFA
jgi:hypothetical protein